MILLENRWFSRVSKLEIAMRSRCGHALNSCISECDSGCLRWILLNLMGLYGLDYSAALELATLARKAREAQKYLVLTELRPCAPRRSTFSYTQRQYASLRVAIRANQLYFGLEILAESHC